MNIAVIVHPNSKKPRVEKDLFGQLHVYVNQPAQEGKANKACVETLAEYFKVSKSQVVLIKGLKSKLKTFKII